VNSTNLCIGRTMKTKRRWARLHTVVYERICMLLVLVFSYSCLPLSKCLPFGVDLYYSYLLYIYICYLGFTSASVSVLTCVASVRSLVRPRRSERKRNKGEKEGQTAGCIYKRCVTMILPFVLILPTAGATF